MYLPSPSNSNSNLIAADQRQRWLGLPRFFVDASERKAVPPDDDDDDDDDFRSVQKLTDRWQPAGARQFESKVQAIDLSPPIDLPSIAPPFLRSSLTSPDPDFRRLYLSSGTFRTSKPSLLARPAFPIAVHVAARRIAATQRQWQVRLSRARAQHAEQRRNVVSLLARKTAARVCTRARIYVCVCVCGVNDSAAHMHMRKIR